MTVLRWQDPPARAGLVLDPVTVQELRSRPGEWALIRVYRSHRAGMPKCPGGVEIRYRYRMIDGARFSELYARWVG